MLATTPDEACPLAFPDPDVRGLTDAELVAWIRTIPADCTNAIGELYVHHHRVVLGWAVQNYGFDLAEDLAAEAFALMIVALLRGGGPQRRVRPYLFSTVRNLRVSQLRRLRETVVDEMSEEWSNASGARMQCWPDSHDLADDLTVRDAMRRLPPRYRQVLWWLDVEGRSQAWVGQKLALSANAVAQLAFRARRALREHLPDRLDAHHRRRRPRNGAT